LSERPQDLRRTAGATAAIAPASALAGATAIMLVNRDPR
jgi:hypothetical protein